MTTAVANVSRSPANHPLSDHPVVSRQQWLQACATVVAARLCTCAAAASASSRAYVAVAAARPRAYAAAAVTGHRTRGRR